MQVITRRPGCPLTYRQLQIIRLAADGMTMKEIAQELEISPNVVNHDREKMSAKLETMNITQTVALCIRQGWI